MIYFCQIALCLFFITTNSLFAVHQENKEIKYAILEKKKEARLEHKIKYLRKRLTHEYCNLDEEVTDEFLKNELEKVDFWYGRSFAHLATLIVMQERINTNETHLIITKKSIKNGINEYLSNEKMLKLNVKIETNEERQERHHKENMMANIIGHVLSAIINNL